MIETGRDDTRGLIDYIDFDRPQDLSSQQQVTCTVRAKRQVAFRAFGDKQPERDPEPDDGGGNA